ncbi:MAG: bifunctional metallophosphatase/5'-nucleotidase [Candidatus Marinimicrobia bacterium]|nr:bifunctional metallophosphatase/5'-nucleotidase [Candidatus Neomarinimicrobiota bacterium]
MGGLPRKATALKQLRNEATDLLIVDAGDLFFAKPRLGRLALEKGKIRAETMIKAFNITGMDAVNIGERDLTAGLDYLKELEARADFPFLCANLVDVSDAHPFERSMTVRKAGLDIGLVGVSSILGRGDDYRFTDVMSALNEIIPDLSAKTDLVVLLLHGTNSDLVRILKAKLPIDLILQSHERRAVQEATANRMITYVLGIEGRYLDVIDISISRRGATLVDLTGPKKKLVNAERTLTRLESRTKDTRPSVAAYQNKQKLEASLKKVRERRAAAQTEIDAATNTVVASRLVLKATYADDMEIHDLVQTAVAIQGALPPAAAPAKTATN